MPRKNPEERAAYSREYRAKNAEAISQRKKKYYEKNRDKFLLAFARRREQNPDEFKKYYAEHKRALNEYSRQWYRNNVDWVKERHQKYQKEHAQSICLRNAAYRANKKASLPVDGVLTEEEWKDLLAVYENRCAYCGRKMTKPTIDHIVPLSRGGKHIKANIAPCCQHCNSTKKNKTPQEWVGLSFA